MGPTPDASSPTATSWWQISVKSTHGRMTRFSSDSFCSKFAGFSMIAQTLIIWGHPALLTKLEHATQPIDESFARLSWLHFKHMLTLSTSRFYKTFSQNHGCLIRFTVYYRPLSTLRSSIFSMDNWPNVPRSIKLSTSNRKLFQVNLPAAARDYSNTFFLLDGASCFQVK